MRNGAFRLENSASYGSTRLSFILHGWFKNGNNNWRWYELALARRYLALADSVPSRNLCYTEMHKYMLKEEIQIFEYLCLLRQSSTIKSTWGTYTSTMYLKNFLEVHSLSAKWTQSTFICNMKRKTAEHLFCSCYALNTSRLKFLNRRCTHPSEIWSTNPVKVISFMNHIIPNWDGIDTNNQSLV